MNRRPGGELASRPLHFFWICDCSGSMQADGKIQSLNNAIKEAAPHMQKAAEENPNAQVFLRRIPPKIIPDAECQIVDEGMRKYATVKDYKIDVKGNALLIYTAEQDIEALANIFKDTHPDPLENVELMTTLRHVIHFSPMLVFQLVDGTRRTFQTQRYCFLGSVDDWIAIGKPGKLPALVKKYVKHLGQDSYVELW